MLLSPQGQFAFLAGPPAWAIDETTLRNVIEPGQDLHIAVTASGYILSHGFMPAAFCVLLLQDESLNFFYIWPALDTVGLPSPTSLLGIALPSVDPLRLVSRQSQHRTSIKRDWGALG